MKIIKNKYVEPKPDYPKTIECPACSSIFVIDENDVLIKESFIIYPMRKGKQEERLGYRR